MTQKTLQKVLLIEDEPDIQTVARLALEALGGFEVAVSSSGLEGMDRALSFLPDVILLDVMMPDMDGTMTFARLREIELVSRVPIIFMTAKVQPQEVLFYNKLGAAGVIEKPFDPMTLHERVRVLWSGAVNGDAAG